MADHTSHTDTKNGAMPPIPDEHAQKLRHVAHDLSNALEIIVQTSYLLQHSGEDGQSAQWLAMMDDGLQKALRLNMELRTYLKANSEA
jgi:hypothetical protein